MTQLSKINLEFLSNEELINILQSVLEEIDTLASQNAHRSTTYLAVSAIEGVFRELINLLGLTPSNVATWPKRSKKNPTPKDIEDLTLEDLGKILRHKKKLPKGFHDLYDRVRIYRNYMHTARELKNLLPIDQAVAHLALACLTALLDQYSPLRFIAAHQWRLVCGNAHPQSSNSFDMQHSGEHFALLVSELPAKRFKQIEFRVNIPRGRIFNFVYDYKSKNRFMAARIDKRLNQSGRADDEGLIKCSSWHRWDIIDRYAEASEPNPELNEHAVRVILAPRRQFAIVVDNMPLKLKNGMNWDFNPEHKIGFMSEIGTVSVKDVTVQ